jgi:tetratricopeptide (TPR) repeat protein
MRASLAIATAAVLAAISWPSPASAEHKKQPNKPQPPIGAKPHPVAANPRRPAPARSSAPPRKTASAGQRPDRHDELARRGEHVYPHGHSVYYDDDWIGFRYPYYDAYPYGYGSYYYGYPNYYYSESVPDCDSAGPAFGPQIGHNGVPPPPGDEPEPKKGANRSANVRSSASAWKSIGYGDAMFAKRRYAEAADRYRRASDAAPQLAEAWFRRAFALTAIHRYDLAVDYVKRGLRLDPKWPKIAFDGKDTLWTDAEAKKEYFATLAKLAADNPADSDILFLVGVHFHIDGQEVQAKKYFNRALRIAGANAEHIEAFLGPAA